MSGDDGPGRKTLNPHGGQYRPGMFPWVWEEELRQAKHISTYRVALYVLRKWWQSRGPDIDDLDLEAVRGAQGCSDGSMRLPGRTPAVQPHRLPGVRGACMNGPADDDPPWLSSIDRQSLGKKRFSALPYQDFRGGRR